jgi:hypothetical protein
LDQGHLQIFVVEAENHAIDRQRGTGKFVFIGHRLPPSCKYYTIYSVYRTLCQAERRTFLDFSQKMAEDDFAAVAAADFGTRFRVDYCFSAMRTILVTG